MEISYKNYSYEDYGVPETKTEEIYAIATYSCDDGFDIPWELLKIYNILEVYEWKKLEKI